MTTIEALDRRLNRRDRSAISSPYLHAAQRRHFFLFDVVPAALTLAAIALLFVHPLSKTDIVLFLVMWLATGLGLTVGFHRLFSHRAFAAGPAVSVALLILGSMAGRGPMISWVAMHRRHHECSDREGDLHSPNMHGASPMQRLRGWLHAHWTWMMQPRLSKCRAIYARSVARSGTGAGQPSLLRLGRAWPVISCHSRRRFHRKPDRHTHRLSLGRRRTHVRRRTVDVGDQLVHASPRLTAFPYARRQQPQLIAARPIGLGRGLAQQPSCISELGGVRTETPRDRFRLLADPAAAKIGPRVGCQISVDGAYRATARAASIAGLVQKLAPHEPAWLGGADAPICRTNCRS